jgi:hypothetical protein
MVSREIHVCNQLCYCAQRASDRLNSMVNGIGIGINIGINIDINKATERPADRSIDRQACIRPVERISFGEDLRLKR